MMCIQFEVLGMIANRTSIENRITYDYCIGSVKYLACYRDARVLYRRQRVGN